MAAKKRGTSEDGYNKTFPRILRELIEQNNTTIQAVANQIGITRQAVSQYCNGETQPNGETLLKIADYFGVSCDYLLRGISAENICIKDDLGLSEKSIKILKALNRLDNKRAEAQKYGVYNRTSFFAVFNSLIEKMERSNIIKTIESASLLRGMDEDELFTSHLNRKFYVPMFGDGKKATEMCKKCVSAAAILEASGCKILERSEAQDYIKNKNVQEATAYYEAVLGEMLFGEDDFLYCFDTLYYNRSIDTCNVYEYVNRSIEELQEKINEKKVAENNNADDNETE